MSPRRLLGAAFAFSYQSAKRIQFKLFSLLVGGAFAGFGRNSVVQCPIRLAGQRRIRIGDSVFIGANSWLQAMDDGDNVAPAISIGSGTSIAGACVITAVRSVLLEDNVLLARNVYISDHTHNYTDEQRPVLAQGIGGIAPVVIGSGSWLGQNVVVCPGVTIGKGTVIGANSVVKSDIPARCIAVGSPARVVKAMGPQKS